MGEIKNFTDYLFQTKKAVKDIFNLLDSYQNILKSIPNELWLLTEEQLINPTDRVKHRLSKEDEYIFNLYSQNCIAGLIFHFAFVAIRKFSEANPTNKEYYRALNKKPKREIKNFFVGRIIEEPSHSGSKINPIQIGLIIYAARNQWAHHIEEEKKSKDTIFDILASRTSIYSKTKYIHPAFDSKVTGHRILASNVLDLLGWKDYENYEIDMREMAKDFR